MLTHAEIYILKIALQQGICTVKQVLSQIDHLEGKALAQMLMERDLITRDQWSECLEEAKALPQYPGSAENIHKDNQILLEYFQKHTSLSEDLLEKVLKESQHQSQTSPSPERIDEILLKEKAITREDLFSLGIYDGHPLSCQSCQYTITLSRYYPWHRIPCLFCVDQLLGPTSSKASSEKTKTPVSKYGDKASKIVSAPGFFFKGIQSSISESGNSSSEGYSHSSDRTNPLVGETFGKYQILTKVGKGGMGAVYKAYDPGLDRVVALKTILGEAAEDPEQIRRFQKEARVAARLFHKNISPLYEFSNFEGTYFFTMPYIDGKDLQEYVQEREKLTPEEALDLMIPVTEAVVYAHKQGVIHRDIKPPNIMLDKEGKPLLMDFGLAKQLGSKETPLTKTGTVVGTVFYMAPEQALGGKNVGYSADQYALGGVLYFLLSGRPPFQGQEPMKVIMQVIKAVPPKLRTLRAEISEDLEFVIHKCLEKEPGKRYPSVDSLLEDLKALRKREPLLVRPIEKIEEISRDPKEDKKSLKKIFIIGAVALLIGILGIGLILYLS